MKRLDAKNRNTGFIPVELQPKEYSEFKNKLMTALKKFGSSRKTKAVHKLIHANIVYPALVSGEGADMLAGLHKTAASGLNGILLNLLQYDDSLAGQGVVSMANKILELDTIINSEKTFVNEKRLLKIEKLQEDRKELVEKFLKGLDYIKMIDGIYFAWLLLLSHEIINKPGNMQNTIVTTAADTLANTLKKMYLGKSSKKMEPEVHKLLEAIAIYFINIYFMGKSATYTLGNMQKGFDEDTIEAIKRTKVTKFDKFNDLAKMLSETELMSMTPNLFDSLMVNFFGKYAYEQYIQRSLVEYIAFMANGAHPTQLFKDFAPIDDRSHLRLEELLLNVQKTVKVYTREEGK